LRAWRAQTEGPAHVARRAGRRARRADPAPERVVTADATGRFEVRGARAGGFLRVHAALDPDDIFGAMGIPTDPLLLQRVEGAPGSTVDVGTLRLPSLRTIRLRVLDAEGRPAGGHVMLHRSDASHGTHGHHLGDDGRVEVSGVPTGVPLRADVTNILVHGELEGRFVLDDTPSERTVTVTGAGMVILRFHPVGKASETLVVNDPRVTWGEDGRFGGGPSGRHANIRHRFEPGSRSDIRVRAEGYRTKLLGKIVISSTTPTYVDVEMEPY
jgi:hypothetical protein